MKYRLLFCLILITGLVLRLYHVWTAPYAYANCDTCTIWIMARHILRGEFALFFYGQYYLGPLEPLTVALFFMFLGIKASTLYLGNIFYSSLFIISSYFLGKEFKDKTVGLIMMLYSALPPLYFFKESIVPLGYHIEILFLGNILFILTLKVPRIPYGLKKTFYYILLGLCAGIGFWTHYIIFYYLLPVSLYLTINEKWKSLIKNIIPTIASFFFISLPFWFFTFRYNFATFRFRSQQSPPSEILKFIGILIYNIGDMFNLNFRNNSIIMSIISCIYIISIFYFIIGAIFNKKNSIFLFLFISILLFFVGYRPRLYTGGGYYYILPILTFMCTVFGYFAGCVVNRIRLVGLCIIFLIISFNMADIWKTISIYKGLSNSNKQEICNRIKFLEENKIYRYMGHERYSRVPVFFSDEKVVATGYMESEYPPYEDAVEKSNRIAFEDVFGGNWRPTIENICTSYNFHNGLFWNFKPHIFETKVIRPIGWYAYASSNTRDANYALDRNYDKYWSSKGGKRSGMSFTIDMRGVYTICKLELFNAHHTSNYPVGCKIQVSRDRHEWIDTASIENVQPFFWSGPRVYWHHIDGRVEWYFKPVEARFIRLVQIGKDPRNPWEINEIFVYGYLGDKEYRVRDYVMDAKEITRFLINKNINFAYVDFWLSAKIRELSKDKVEALVPYSSYLPLRKNMSREIQLARDRAFIVRIGDTDELEGIFNEFELPFKKVMFKYYVIYYLPDLSREFESLPSLMWIGVGLVKHSLRDYSNWLYGMRFYEKAIKYYPNNFLAYLKTRALPYTRFFPKKQRYISFINGVRFLGYSIRGGKPVPGGIIRIEYFWEAQKEPEDNLSVFVHFIKDKEIVFQNDHKFLYQFQSPLMPLVGERFREVLKLNIPKDIKPGMYQILIGLWNEKTQKRIYIEYPLKKRPSKQMIIGELLVSNGTPPKM